ncbi:hypothetical protein HDC94_001422 [Leifsonia sp. AK011]|uniref:hypothetical protein n=1 Tax=Leifsonia sp. AK011 TaxID=2723075 RepID=UPI0015C7B80F|nr:hypothetical protein [Leifsonia sp. AK011]NYF10266.1 hypothetical protein [Leifsonia sp. AK011]
MRDEWAPLVGTRRIARLSRSVSNGFLDLLLVPLQVIGFAFSKGGEVSVNFSSGRLRFGRHEIPFSEIDTAKTAADAAIPGNIDLHLSTSRGSGFVVQLHNGVESIIPEATRAALLRVIPLTSIALPTDPFDPTGKNSRRIFPHHLSRDAAYRLVLDPPRDAHI